MESGLEGRNNIWPVFAVMRLLQVSMESGLEGRNNDARPGRAAKPAASCLNGVRPRRPEQCEQVGDMAIRVDQSQWSPA